MLSIVSETSVSWHGPAYAPWAASSPAAHRIEEKNRDFIRCNSKGAGLWWNPSIGAAESKQQVGQPQVFRDRPERSVTYVTSCISEQVPLHIFVRLPDACQEGDALSPVYRRGAC